MTMPNVTRGLVIDTPWIDLILSGEKSWEMRSTSTSHRGWFGLIRKGSGAVVGVARLDDCGAALSPNEMLANIDKHHISERAIRDGAVAKWTTPWKLGAVKRLARPVPYRHKPGAVTWVVFDDDVANAIAQLRGEGAVAALPAAREPAPIIAKPVAVPPAMPKTIVARPAASPIAVSSSAPGFIGETELNEANIRNSHFYIKAFINRFPADLIGGSNKASLAPRTAVVDWGGATCEKTDIDGTKGIFRGRGWVGRFLADNNAAPGDKVRVTETAPYRYSVRLIKRGTL